MADIVERLREATAFFEQPPPPKGNPPAWPIQTMTRDAADEIERLRAAVDIALEAFRQIDRKSAEYLLALNTPKQPGAT
jgi:hypothetical protein